VNAPYQKGSPASTRKPTMIDTVRPLLYNAHSN
jgi:hypothetical protein